ncbi:MAG TPA: DNA mismatch repair endonuclease MutL [Thermoanaerobaculia bacterium]|nr:DNA mismatch repair endonuclease MutL [Thermoanaerobaculia bacterium]
MSRGSRIRPLSDHLISQIAAGEVVERPASVLKEAIENALDAGARRIEIELAAGGRQRVRVSDDGCGMGAEDVELAFARHATSKISEFDDLEKVGTLGFRGEALASIAAVARVSATSAERNGEGTRVAIEGGRVVEIAPASRPRGTELDVTTLFYNVPARREFLKGPPTELRRCLEVAQGYALSRPEVAITLVHEGRELLRGDATGSDAAGRLERIAQLFGAELAANLVPIESGWGAVSGYVGNPSTTRGRRLFVFVNGRLLRDRALLGVFYRAVRDEWQSDQFPALFLHLDLPPEEVDVNVHPQKAEIRFRDPRRLGQVGSALRRALAAGRGAGSAPLRAPRAGELEGAGAAPRAWEGLGGIAALAPRSLGGASEVREAATARLAEVRYEPLAPKSVPLGRGGGAPSVRLLGQYKGALILLEAPDGLYLVDQHAAHERILYERFRRALAERSAASQALLQPIILELAPAEHATLSALSPRLEERGFALSDLSGGAVGLTAVPAALSADVAEAVLRRIASDSEGVEGDDPDAALDRELLDAVAAGRACRSAVRIHRPLSREEMERVVSELFDAEQPWACPHGRPTVLEMRDAELERRFGRR